MSVLILGAAGFLGVNLVDAALAAGVTPRCARRRRTNVMALRRRGVPMVELDLDEPASLREALAGAEVVYHLAGHYPRLSLDRAATLTTGMRQMAAVLDAAARARVRRLVYVSSTATVAPDPEGVSSERATFSGPPGFGVYHDLKWSMEAMALAEDRLEVLIACPGACIGPWDLRVGTSALLVGLARGLDPPHPEGVVNLVDARDVAAALLALGAHRSPPRRVILAAGNHHLHALLVALARRYGVPPPAPPLSELEAIRRADEAEAAAKSGRPSLSREIVDLVIHGVPVDAFLSRDALAATYRPLSETLDAFDAWARRMKLIPTEQHA